MTVQELDRDQQGQQAQQLPTQEDINAFGGRMAEILNGGALALMCSIGHRTGLFDALSVLPPSTTHEIARQSGLSERYIREWLGAMVTGGIVKYEPKTKKYHLPQAHAACLTRAAIPNNAAASAQWIAVLGYVEDQVVRAFRHGAGVPYSAYNRFHEVMAEESGQTVVAALNDHILPLVPGLVERLEQGIDVCDIACGSGHAILKLAEQFPNSRFTGVDISEEAIAHASRESVKRELTNVRFVQKDLSELSERAKFDLVTAFDAIHDQARPDKVLRNIVTSLRPGGTLLMQDILAHTHVNDNLDNPMGPFLYTISTMHCMSVSLAQGGPGLGACWGKEKALEMLADAGFENVTVQTLPHDPINFYYLAHAPKV